MPDNPRLCPECGSDSWLSQEFPRVRDELQRVRREYERQASLFAIERAKWELAEMTREETRKSTVSKTERQRRVINRLEAKLRKLGVAPHEPKVVPGG